MVGVAAERYDVGKCGSCTCVRRFRCRCGSDVSVSSARCEWQWSWIGGHGDVCATGLSVAGGLAAVVVSVIVDVGFDARVELVARRETRIVDAGYVKVKNFV